MQNFGYNFFGIPGCNTHEANFPIEDSRLLILGIRILHRLVTRLFRTMTVIPRAAKT